jgi:uncharacterized Zn finger protein
MMAWCCCYQLRFNPTPRDAVVEALERLQDHQRRALGRQHARRGRDAISVKIRAEVKGAAVGPHRRSAAAATSSADPPFSHVARCEV